MRKPRPRLDPVTAGDVINQWTVLESRGSANTGDRLWLCRCSCGRESVRSTYQARAQAGCKSCATRRRYAAGTGPAKAVHGQWDNPLYKRWVRMRARCRHGHRNYEGVAVCDRWQDFSSFMADVGSPPSPKHSLDRIDNDRGYEPGNVRWATSKEQNRNKRTNRHVTAFGETRLMEDWRPVAGLRAGTISARLSRGWAAEDAVSRPAAKRLRNLATREERKS